MSKCRACGGALDGAEKFCGACGTPVQSAEQVQETSGKSAVEAKTPLQDGAEIAQSGRAVSNEAKGPPNNLADVAAAQKAPAVATNGDRPFKELAISGLILSISVFAADLISASNSEFLSDFLGDLVPFSANVDIFELIYRSAPMFVMVLLSALFSAVCAALLLRGKNTGPRHPLHFAVAGLFAGIVAVILVLMFVNDYHYYIPRFDREIVPIGLLVLASGFGVAILFQALSIGRNRQ